MGTLSRVLYRETQTALYPPIPSRSFWKASQGVPRPPWRLNSLSRVSWVCPGPPPSCACLKDLPREVSRRHPSQIPEPPQLVPLDGEIQLPIQVPCGWPNFPPYPSGRAQSPCKENSFLPLEPATLFLWSRPKSDDHRWESGAAPSSPWRIALASASLPTLLQSVCQSKGGTILRLALSVFNFILFLSQLHGPWLVWSSWLD